MANINVAFSVIMPTYNNSSFIRRAIRSLMDQSHEQWELIIVDDGSTDNACSNFERTNLSLQLVQAVHKKKEDRWLARSEYVMEDIFYYVLA